MDAKALALEMKEYPTFNPDHLLEEIKEWTAIIHSEGGLEKMDNAKKASLPVVELLLHDQSIMHYIKCLMDAQSAVTITLITMGGEAGRKQILEGKAFVPLFMEILSLGYRLAEREHNLSACFNTVTH